MVKQKNYLNLNLNRQKMSFKKKIIEFLILLIDQIICQYLLPTFLDLFFQELVKLFLYFLDFFWNNLAINENQWKNIKMTKIDKKSLKLSILFTDEF